MKACLLNLVFLLLPLNSQAQLNRYFTISGLTFSSNQSLQTGGISIEQGWFNDRYLLSIEGGISRFALTPTRNDLVTDHDPKAGENVTCEEGPSYFLQLNIGYMFQSFILPYAGIGLGLRQMVDIYIPGNLALPDVRNKEYISPGVLIGGGIKYKVWKGITLDAGIFTTRGLKLGMHVMY